MIRFCVLQGQLCEAELKYVQLWLVSKINHKHTTSITLNILLSTYLIMFCKLINHYDLGGICESYPVHSGGVWQALSQGDGQQ